MIRHRSKPRDNWQHRVESVGMIYHTIDGETYWDESACYRFNRSQIDALDIATAELQERCIEAVELVIRRDLFNRLCIPDSFKKAVIRSWDMDEPTIYGRFDLSYNGHGQPRMLEYNADTPTALLEASVVQWFWLQDCHPEADQFNSIHEKLIAGWKDWPYIKQGNLHFACASGSVEDLGNLEYLRDTAVQGGFTTKRLFIEDIGWDQAANRFVDMENEPVNTLFKLYPWEWMVREEFGQQLAGSSIRMIEPAWKMILSNKGILPLLWEFFPDHPNLLEACFGDRSLHGDHVRKPLFSREGENIELVRGAESIATEGSYGSEGFILQRYAPLPCFDGNYPVIGSWVIAGEPAGIGIREDRSEITTNCSRFVPHYFVED